MRPNDLIQQERRLTETMSETSEGTTTTTSVSGKSSIDNVEELRGLAAVLGIVNPDDLQQERFRVDRRKLEQMLLGEAFYIRTDSAALLISRAHFATCQCLFNFYERNTR
jgi:hypothetical protein